MTGFSVIVNPLIVGRYMFINGLIQISGLFKTHYLGHFKINVFMERNYGTGHYILPEAINRTSIKDLFIHKTIKRFFT